MKRLLFLALLAACVRHTPTTEPPLPASRAPRGLSTPASATAPKQKERVVNRCPRFAPYDRFLSMVPWNNAECLNLVAGDRVYEVPPLSVSGKSLYVVRSAASSVPVPMAELVFIIGQGPYVPPPELPKKQSFTVTFHIERVVARKGQPEDFVTVEVFSGRSYSLVKSEVLKAGADWDAFDYDFTFNREQMLLGIGVRVKGQRDQWINPHGDITVNAADIVDLHRG